MWLIKTLVCRNKPIVYVICHKILTGMTVEQAIAAMDRKMQLCRPKTIAGLAATLTREKTWMSEAVRGHL